MAPKQQRLQFWKGDPLISCTLALPFFVANVIRPFELKLGQYRFGKIIYIDQKEKKVHVQYYEHSSKTYLQEISNSQELFLCPQLCWTFNLESVLGKAIVHHDYCPASGETIDPLHYFCRFVRSRPSNSHTELTSIL